jgi:hypothetical protein
MQQAASLSKEACVTEPAAPMRVSARRAEAVCAPRRLRRRGRGQRQLARLNSSTLYPNTSPSSRCTASADVAALGPPRASEDSRHSSSTRASALRSAFWPRPKGVSSDASAVAGRLESAVRQGGRGRARGSALLPRGAERSQAACAPRAARPHARPHSHARPRSSVHGWRGSAPSATATRFPNPKLSSLAVRRAADRSSNVLSSTDPDPRDP